jgi:curved DNA-binding protein CbpA
VSHYEVLGVTPQASAGEIRRAYLALARAHHPDFHSLDPPARRLDAERTMQRLNEAWLVLGDRRLRAAYDLSLPVAVDPAWSPGAVHPDFVPFDAGDDEVEAEPDGGGTGRAVPRWQQVLPAACLAGAVAALAAATVLGRVLVGVGLILLVGAGVGFVLTPLLAVLRTYERDPER